LGFCLNFLELDRVGKSSIITIIIITKELIKVTLSQLQTVTGALYKHTVATAYFERWSIF